MLCLTNLIKGDKIILPHHYTAQINICQHFFEKILIFFATKKPPLVEWLIWQGKNEIKTLAMFMMM